MAGPVANKVILPSDTGNTGKNVRTQTRVIGPDTVHEHYVVPVSRYEILGVYSFAIPNVTVSAAAHANTAGYAWLIVGTGVGNKVVRIRRVEFTPHGVALAAIVSRVSMELITFSGTPTGAAITAAKHDSLYAATVADVRTASTGLTITAGAVLHNCYLQGVITAVGVVQPVVYPWVPTDDDGMIVIRSGQGIVWRQGDASDADLRFQLNIVVEDIDTA